MVTFSFERLAGPERLGEPFCADGGVDLGVEHERPGPRPRSATSSTTSRSPTRRTVTAWAPAARAMAARSASGNCTRRDVVAHRREVVDLGPVGAVVVDGDEQLQPQPDGGLDLGERHERAAVADRRHGRAVRAGDRGSDRRSEAEPDRLKAVGEHPGAGIRDRQEHRRVAEEVSGVDRHRLVGGAAARSSSIENVRGSIHSSVPASSYGSSAHRSRGDRLGQLRRAPVRWRGGRGAPARRPAAAPSAAASPSTVRSAGRWRPNARGLQVDLGDRGVRCDQGPVARRPHVQRGAGGEQRRRPGRAARAANGEAKPPEMPSAYGSPANRPLAGADVASSAPTRSARRSSSSRALGQHRAPAGDDHRPLGPLEQIGKRGDRLGRRVRGRQRRQRRLAAARCPPAAGAGCRSAA